MNMMLVARMAWRDIRSGEMALLLVALLVALLILLPLLLTTAQKLHPKRLRSYFNNCSS